MVRGLVFDQQRNGTGILCLSPFSKTGYIERSFTAHFLSVSIIGSVLSEREQEEVQLKRLTAQSIQNLFFFFFIYAISIRV
jgi:hypothetical protein